MRISGLYGASPLEEWGSRMLGNHLKAHTGFEPVPPP
jgi:hypothetical protein